MVFQRLEISETGVRHRNWIHDMGGTDHTKGDPGNPEKPRDARTSLLEDEDTNPEEEPVEEEPVKDTNGFGSRSPKSERRIKESR